MVVLDVTSSLTVGARPRRPEAPAQKRLWDWEGDWERDWEKDWERDWERDWEALLESLSFTRSGSR